MSINRRTFLSSSSVFMGAWAGLGQARALRAADGNNAKPEFPLFISTWGFGKPANEAALKVLEKGGSVLDAVEQGIWVVESDGHNPSVGLSGMPNAAGVVQLDSCIMDGVGHKAGSVAALEGIEHPISVARRVMEKTPHVMLVGEGAQKFALAQGFELAKSKSSKTEPARKDAKTKNHDTIALLGIDKNGNIAGGCSTSGWGGKLPGRVGDSPIIGSGLYVDNEIGAAGATGLGENVMRYCGSFLVVEYMRQGLSPEEACLETIKRIARQDPKGFDLSINFIAIDKKGRFGGAGTGQGFPFSVTTPSFSKVVGSPGATKQDVGPVGGNRKP